MRLFKGIFIFGVVVLLIVGAMIVHYATPPKTVDFRGRIQSVTVSDNGSATLFATNEDTGNFVFKINKKSRLENCCGEKIAVTDLSEGALIDIRCRTSLFGKEDARVVKLLKAYS